ncbi:MAG: phytanoyl-CoA dioxygenase family protein [Myxococcota bacterium]
MSRGSPRSFAALLRKPGDDEERLALARDPGYWRELDATLHVGVDNPPVRGDNVDTSGARADLLRDGFFQLPNILDTSTLHTLHRCIQVVTERGWPGVFAFMYDEMWHALRQPAFHGLLQGLLGPRYRQLPRIWTHVVPVREGARGWPPHVDYVVRPSSEEEVPERLTLWVALTDATTDNGCLYVIPRHRAPELSRRFHDENTLRMEEAITLLHAAQALPVTAGTVVGWGFDLVHWGGHSTGRAAGPRVAISLELLRQGAVPTAEELPLLEPETGIPSVEARTRLIGLALQAFGSDVSREPLAHQYLGLGRVLAR